MQDDKREHRMLGQQVLRDAEAGGEIIPESMKLNFGGVSRCNKLYSHCHFRNQEKRKDFRISHHGMANNFVQISFQIATSK
jgi:hypothetical protein